MIKMSKNPIIAKSQRLGCRFSVVHVWSPIIAKTRLWSPIIAIFSGFREELFNLFLEKFL
jgi:hypothetical protein